jgi:alpha-D-ribose 1-methylphosphonate 5-triphosphate synthase subunit PhnG
MESNRSSDGRHEPGGLGRLAAAVEEPATQDLTRLPDAEAATQVLALRRLLDRLEGEWLRQLAAVDARGAAGADQGVVAPSTTSWLRGRLRAGGATASGWVRTARALFRGPLGGTGQALTAGELSVAHATVLAAGTHHLSPATAAAAEPVLLETAGRMDPPLLRKVVGHLVEVADPDTAQQQSQRRHERRGLWMSPTLEGMVAVDGLLEAEAGETLLTALEPLARPASAEDDCSGSQRRADALMELARRALEGAGSPSPVGSARRSPSPRAGQPARPARHPGWGGEWVGPLPTETVRRLTCDATLTRVLVTRQPGHPSGHHHAAGEAGDGLAARLRAAVALLPPALGGPPTQPLEVGRATRVVSPAQRTALAVRDGGCRFPGCDRPPAWCEAHHLRHWLHGGPTDLGNLVLLCWTHHRAVHEGRQHLHRLQPAA